MPGNSQRKGAIRKKGRGRTAGSGGRVRRGLEGKGPTPKAEDRPYHAKHKAKVAAQRRGPARSTTRARTGADVVAGRNPVLEALQADVPVVKAYVAEGAENDDRLREILAICAERGIALLQGSRTDLDRIAHGAVHQGVALQIPPYDYLDAADLLGTALSAETPGLVVALDQITDPRNLGAIIRSAAAFGAHGVVIPERRSAQMTAAAWKTSAGAAARCPVARATNLNRVLTDAAKAGFSVVGLAGEAEVDITAAPGLDGPTVLVVGSEGDGLSRLVRQHCDTLASIPITSAVESLNAGVAASIALYEISRVRG